MVSRFQIAIFIIVFGLFVFLRLWQLESSLLFVSDIGRDALVLQSWSESGKPPLLGPQNSAIAFNQSAWYFYILFPLFVLTGHSVFSSVITGILIYGAVFVGLWWLTRKDADLNWMLIGVMLLMAIQPEFVRQTRFIWNPSFVAPSILVAGMSWLLLKRRKAWYLYALLGLGLAAAVGFSFSAAPVVLAFVLILVLEKDWKAVASFGLGLVLVFAPTFAFYIRHYQLIGVLFDRGLSGSAQDHTLLNRVVFVGRYLIVEDRLKQSFVLVLLTVMGVCFWRLVVASKSLDRTMKLHFLAIVALSLGLYLLVPVTFFPHYVFALAILMMMGLFLMPKRVYLVVMVGLVLVWMTPSNLRSYFEEAPRTVAETQACMKRVCDEIEETVFVAVTSSHHPYHVGEEFRFLLAEAGCMVEKIEVSPGAASKMLVVADGTDYEHGVSAFHELILFGASTEMDRVDCGGQLSVHRLEKS